MTTSSKIKLILDSMNIYASELTDEDAEELMEVLGNISARISMEQMECRRNNTKRNLTNEPAEMMERIRIRLYTNSCKDKILEMMKPR